MHELLFTGKWIDLFWAWKVLFFFLNKVWWRLKLFSWKIQTEEQQEGLVTPTDRTNLFDWKLPAVDKNAIISSDVVCVWFVFQDCVCVCVCVFACLPSVKGRRQRCPEARSSRAWRRRPDPGSPEGSSEGSCSRCLCHWSHQRRSPGIQTQTAFRPSNTLWPLDAQTFVC